MPLRAEEITSILSKELQNYESKLEVEDVGTVLKVGDGIATVYGLLNAMAGELLEFPGGLMGMVLNLEESSVGVAIFGDDSGIKEGDLVKRTGNVASIPVSRAMLGRIVTPLGEPIDGKGPITGTTRMPIEAVAPNVLARQPVREPLMTGIKAIDSMIPIGRGQRELIIGDRQTGKTPSPSTRSSTRRARAWFASMSPWVRRCRAWCVSPTRSNATGRSSTR
jgi:F-type H+-transporting ATPase subunit alpha